MFAANIHLCEFRCVFMLQLASNACCLGSLKLMLVDTVKLLGVDYQPTVSTAYRSQGWVTIQAHVGALENRFILTDVFYLW